MYDRIVVGTDGSPTAGRAVATAAELARLWGAKLHVVTAYRGSAPAMASLAGAAMVDTGAHQALQHEAATDIGKQAVETHGKDLDVELHVVAGDAPGAIVDVAGAVEAGLVVVGSKGMRGARRVLGSVPNSVSHNAPCAVLIVKTD